MTEPATLECSSQSRLLFCCFLSFLQAGSLGIFLYSGVCAPPPLEFLKPEVKNDEWVVMRVGLNDNDKSHICAFALDWLRVFHPLARRRTCWNFFFLSPSFALLADGALVCVAV